MAHSIFILMKITLLVVGKTTTGYLQTGITEYCNRLAHYINFDIKYLSDLKSTKSLSEAQQKTAEGASILKALEKSDFVALLDEKGKEFTSTQFATYIEGKMASVPKRLVFVIGGPYGFSDDVYARANDKISLSKMTFSHEMVRVIFTEQLYRAFSIINHEPYHHD